MWWLLAACFDGDVYIVEGTVVEIGPDEVTLDHEPVPGLMGAMVMPFPVADKAMLEGLEPGDKVIARYELSESSGKLIQVRVVGHGPVPTAPTPATPEGLVPVRVGERLAPRHLVLQDGSSLVLGPEQTERVALTFIYTRCPQPEFCPAMITRLQQLQAALGEPADPVRIVAVTLDPAYDTPEILSAFAAQVGAGPRWQFAQAAEGELDGLAMLAGLPVMPDPSAEPGAVPKIGHGLRLLVLDRGGLLIERYDDARFPTDRVVAQLLTGEPKGDPTQSGTSTPP
jgi:protein SCO1/2